MSLATLKSKAWLCVPPFVLCMLDQGITLAGQDPTYWAGDRSIVTEANPWFNWLLRQHPLAFEAGIAAWVCVFCLVILALPRRAAMIVSIAIVLGHSSGAATWICWLAPYGYWLVLALFLVSAIVIVRTFEAHRGGSDARGRTPRSRWIAEQVARIKSLQGQTVLNFTGAEMAFSGGEGDGPPEFQNESLPFLQLNVLYFDLASGETQKFVTYQNDSTWGLCTSAELGKGEPRLDQGSPQSIYRTRTLPELPTGEIRSANVSIDSDGEISQVLLNINGKGLLLLAGEVNEGPGGKLDVVKGDESILVFPEPSRVATVPFRR